MNKQKYIDEPRYKILDKNNNCVFSNIMREGDAEAMIDNMYETQDFAGERPYTISRYWIEVNNTPYAAKLNMDKDYYNIRTFLVKTTEQYNELVQIDERNDLIKIYCQNNELGFPFSEHSYSLKKYGYSSAEDYFRSISQRDRAALNRVNIRELETWSQVYTEIDGLFNLAKYRIEQGSYNSIILNDGCKYNDIVERLSAYGVDKQKALDKLEVLISQTMPEETQYDTAIGEAIASAELPEPDMGMEM